MSKESYLEEFKKSIELLLPAYLVIFDFADTKRRNLYLGHSEVDKDINVNELIIKINQCGTEVDFQHKQQPLQAFSRIQSSRLGNLHF